ncbi:hypothetical protein P3X46_017024, partial [Hevea brasiliensis]
MTINSQQFGVRNDLPTRRVNENQMSQLATSVSKLEAQGSSKLPSQPIKNPKENVCAIVLRSVIHEIDLNCVVNKNFENCVEIWRL